MNGGTGDLVCMGYLLFTIVVVVVIFIIVAFLSKSQVQGSDKGVDENAVAKKDEKPNEEFIEDDPTHHKD